jgi:hypothetical protein
MRVYPPVYKQKKENFVTNLFLSYFLYEGFILKTHLPAFFAVPRTFCERTHPLLFFWRLFAARLLRSPRSHQISGTVLATGDAIPAAKGKPKRPLSLLALHKDAAA